MSEWQWVPAGSVATQRKDVVRLQDGVDYTTMGVRWYGRGAYNRGVVTTDTVKAKSLFRATAGDFVFNRIDTQNGAFDIVPPELDGALATNEFPLYTTDADRLNARFLLLYFQQASVLAQIDSLRAGSEGRSRWKEADFEAWRLPLPDLVEQRRIVDVMSAVDEQVDAVADEVERVKRLLSIVRDGYPEATERALSEIVHGFDSGKSVQTTDEKPQPGEPSVLKLSAVQLGAFSPNEAKRLDDTTGYTPTHLVTEGDLLVTRASGSFDRVGYVAIARGVRPATYMPDLIWRIRPDLTQVIPVFLNHLLCSPSMRVKITSSARGTASMRKINKALLGALQVPLPSIAAQQDYAARCESMAGVLALLTEELGRLRMFRSTLLASLLNQDVEIPESYDVLMEAAS